MLYSINFIVYTQRALLQLPVHKYTYPFLYPASFPGVILQHFKSMIAIYFYLYRNRGRQISSPQQHTSGAFLHSQLYSQQKKNCFPLQQVNLPHCLLFSLVSCEVFITILLLSQCLTFCTRLYSRYCKCTCYLQCAHSTTYRSCSILGINSYVIRTFDEAELNFAAFRIGKSSLQLYRCSGC